MKNYILTSLIILFCTIVRAGDVEFFLDVCRFQDPQDKPYIEVYLTIDGSSVSYVKETNQFGASINVKFRLNKISTDTVTEFVDHYNFLFQVADTSEASIQQGQIDLKRIPVTPGKYMIQVVMADNNDPNGSKVANINEFEIQVPREDGISASDLEFLSRITPSQRETPFLKNGYEMIPYGFNSAFVNEDKLKYYLEVYHSDRTFTDSYFAQATFIKDDQPMFMYDQTQKKQPSAIDIVSGEFDISQLASGTYYLQINLFNKEHPEGTKVSQKIFVFNSRVMPEMKAYVNDEGDPDLFSIYAEEQLDYYIGTLIHYSTDSEIRFAKALKEYDDKKNYMYSFWEKRSTEEKSIETLWKGHLAALDFVNDQYKSTYREGWQTDRGRVFLMYGIPNDVERFPAETMRIPYEIWKYDRLGSQARIIFVFLDDDLATNEYPLVHSNKYGELQNFSWQDMLQNGDTPFNIDPDPGSMRDDYEGNRSRAPGVRN